ncbi:MAG: phage major capsid protein [Hyphomicrobiaceae bacterium]|nr:MAG: phage major capsid protein [Hyphomicrobiaceae bacterium]
MSKETKAWREEKANLLTEMKAIQARAEAGKSDPLDDQQWDNLESREAELSKLIARSERVANLQASLDAPTEEQRNDRQADGPPVTKEEEYRGAFYRWATARKETRLAESDIALLEKRGTSTQIGSTDNLGGYLVPDGFSGELEKYMALYGGMMEAARIRYTATGNPFPWPTVNDTSNKGAIITQGTGGTVGDVTLAEVAFPMAYTFYSKIMKVSWELLQDEVIGVEGLLSELAGERIGRIANEYFTTGDNSGKPQGFITGASSGKTAASATAFTRVELVDLMHSVNPAYRNSPKCYWMFNDSTLAAIKKLAFGSGDDRPLWLPSMRDGAPDTLEGKPYIVNEDMASVASGAKPIAFGDFSKYIIRIAKGYTLTSTRERYWDERANGYAVYARMDGRLVNTSAIKYLTMAS